MLLLHWDEVLTLACNGSRSLYLDGVAWTATQTITWIPLAVLLLYILIRNNELLGVGLTVCGLACCILLADQVASSVCKPLFERWRPANDPSLMYMVDVVKGYRGGSFGFFSSHAANTMAVATFLSLAFRYRPLTCWLLSWVALNCWSRVYLGVHYLGDISVGLIWGAFVGWGIWSLLHRFAPRLHLRRMQFAPRQGFTPGGYSVNSLCLFALGIVLTYLFIVFKALFFFA